MIRVVTALLLAALVTAVEADANSLATRLLSTDRTVLMTALTDLSNRGPSTLRDLEIARMLIGNPDPVIRLGAIQAAARLHDDGAILQLISTMRAADVDLAKEMRTALGHIVGSDIGGADPSVWANWYQTVLDGTIKGIKEVRTAIAAGDFDAARTALVPLMLQKAGREGVIFLLKELGTSDRDAELNKLAREGLAAMNAALAKMVLAEIDPRFAARLAAATVQKPSVGTGTTTGPSTAIGLLPGDEPPSKPLPWIWIGVGVAFVGVFAWLWIYGKKWVAKHPRVEHVTRMFVVRMKTRRISKPK
ncbi:MAG: hypothetical protein AAB263_07780 [Planctomycetota bacterium]